LQSLIAKRGRGASVVDWLDELTADCSIEQAQNWSDRCASALHGCGGLFRGKTGERLLPKREDWLQRFLKAGYGNFEINTAGLDPVKANVPP
jgi:hypothetical protein